MCVCIQEWTNYQRVSWLQTLPSHATCCGDIGVSSQNPDLVSLLFCSGTPGGCPTAFGMAFTCLDLAFKTLQNKTPTYLSILLCHYPLLGTPYCGHTHHSQTCLMFLFLLFCLFPSYSLCLTPLSCTTITYSTLVKLWLSSEPTTHVKWRKSDIMRWRTGKTIVEKQSEQWLPLASSHWRKRHRGAFWGK